MKRFLSTISLLALIFNGGIAQNNFRPGYIITLSRDTLSGFINFSTEKNKCEFKKHETADIQNFTPGNIRGFGSLKENRYYESYGIQSGDTKLNKIFAEMLVRGKANLLVYDDFFYIQKDTLTSKIEKVQMKESKYKGGRYVHAHKTYIGTLNRFFSDCLPSKLLIGDVEYTRKDFVDVFKKYSECSHTDYYLYESPEQRLKITYLFLAGYNRSKLEYPDSDANIFNPDNSFFFGGGFEVPLHFISKNFFLTLEATYNHHEYHAKKEGYTVSGTVLKDYTIDLSVIKTPIGIKINLLNKRLIPYIKTGFSPLFPIQAKWIIMHGGTTEAKYDIDTNTSSLVIFGGLGFQGKISSRQDLFIELRLEKYFEYIDFYGPNLGKVNIPSSVFNKMLVFGVKI